MERSGFATEEDGFFYSVAHFIKFLNDNQVFPVAIAAVLSSRLNDVLDALVNGLVMPILNRDADGDGERDIKKIEDFSISFSGMKFEVGKLGITLLKFLLVTYTIYLLVRLGRKLGKTLPSA